MLSEGKDRRTTPLQTLEHLITLTNMIYLVLACMLGGLGGIFAGFFPRRDVGWPILLIVPIASVFYTYALHEFGLIPPDPFDYIAMFLWPTLANWVCFGLAMVARHIAFGENAGDS
jgi:hypothetical protein